MYICIMIEVCFGLWIIMDLIDLFSKNESKVIDYLSIGIIAFCCITVLLALINSSSALSWFSNHPSFWKLNIISILITFILQIILFIKKD